MKLIIFLILACSLSLVRSRQLTELENKLLRNNCGRFVPGYNSDTPQKSDEADSEFKALYGKKVGNGVAPWVASIVLKRNSRAGREFYVQHGTGSIISPYHIISAAHLIGFKQNAHPDCSTGDAQNAEADLEPSNFAVFLNVSCAVPHICKNVNRTEDQFIPLKVAKIYIEKGYLGDSCYNKESLNDIAVFELENEIKFSEFIYPICVPRNNATPGDGLSNVTLYGYGRDPSDQTTEVGLLRSLESGVEECTESFDTTNLFCTSASNHGLSCDGDSGAGAVIQRPNSNAKEIIGILSAGLNCGDLLKRHEHQKIEHKRLSVAYDLQVDVSKHLPFLCKCCGLCNL